jgi:hypothetical protein
MTWNLTYQAKSFLRNALWIILLVAVLLEQVVWWVVHGLDARLGWRGLGLGVNGAEALFNSVTTLALRFVAARIWTKSFGSIFAPALPQGPIAVFDRSW